ncbi:MAG: hypothetical protein HYZ75_18665 [Elusimicrobia bacterium]|nr:hypothetical protein [Elusimicrobiota bacterium]
MTGSARGTTLVEVVIAILILSVVVAGFSSGLYAAIAGTKQGDARQQASLSARQLQEELKNYVTADPTTAEGAPGSPPWHLPGDACTGCAGGSACWALTEACTHDVSGRLPEEYRTGYLMTLRYRVDLVSSGGETLREVAIDVDWQSPD